MDFLALLHRTAAAFGRFLQLAREPHHHRLLAALLRRLADPAHGERDAAHRPYFHRHLVVRAAHPAALHFTTGFTFCTACVNTSIGSLPDFDLMVSSAP